IQEGEEVTETELAQRLKLSKSTVHYRVSRALRGGWIVNTEQRKGYPAKLSRGTPLPDHVAALPTPERVQEAFERSNPQNTDSATVEHHESEEKTESYKAPFESSNGNGKKETPPPPSEANSGSNGAHNSATQEDREEQEFHTDSRESSYEDEI